MLQRHGAATVTAVDGSRFVPPRITFWLREAASRSRRSCGSTTAARRDSNAHSKTRVRGD